MPRGLAVDRDDVRHVVRSRGDDRARCMRDHLLALPLGERLRARGQRDEGRERRDCRGSRLREGRRTMTTTRRSAEAVWTGCLKDGRGHFDTKSKALSAHYSFGTRFAGEPGTNPEELIAAAHASCFSMA